MNVRVLRDWIFILWTMLNYYAAIAYDYLRDALTASATMAYDWMMPKVIEVYYEYWIPFYEVSKNFIYNCLQDMFRRIANRFSKWTVIFEGKIDNQYLHPTITDPAEVSNANFKFLNATAHCREFWAVVFVLSLYVLIYHILPAFSFWDSFDFVVTYLEDKWFIFVYGEEHHRTTIEEPNYGLPRTVPDEILINGLTDYHITVTPHNHCYTYHHLMNKPAADGTGNIRLVITETEANNGWYAGTMTRGFTGYNEAEMNRLESTFNLAMAHAPNKEMALMSVRAAVTNAVSTRGNRRIPCRPTGTATLADVCVTNSCFNEIHVALDKALAKNRRKLRELLPLAQDAHVEIVVANYNAINNRKKRLRTSNGAGPVNAVFNDPPN